MQILGFESYIIPGSLDTLYLEWDDVSNKFRYFLTSDVPRGGGGGAVPSGRRGPGGVRAAHPGRRTCPG